MGRALAASLSQPTEPESGGCRRHYWLFRDVTRGVSSVSKFCADGFLSRADNFEGHADDFDSHADDFECHADDFECHADDFECHADDFVKRVSVLVTSADGLHTSRSAQHHSPSRRHVSESRLHGSENRPRLAKRCLRDKSTRRRSLEVAICYENSTTRKRVISVNTTRLRVVLYLTRPSMRRFLASRAVSALGLLSSESPGADAARLTKIPMRRDISSKSHRSRSSPCTRRA